MEVVVARLIRPGITVSILLVVCLLKQTAGQITLTPTNQPYNIPESTTLRTSVANINSPSNICNLDSSVYGTVPFDVFRTSTGFDFELVYLGVAYGGRLSYKTRPTYLLQIKCVNGTGFPYTQDVEIDVIPNEAPKITDYPRHNLQLKASKPILANQVIYSVTATDTEGDPLVYSIESTTPSVNYFEIGQRNGKLRTKIDLREATEDQITVTVGVSDGVTKIDDFIIEISITDNNTRPTIQQLPRTMSIPEDTTGGSTIMQLILEDDTPQNTPTLDCTVYPRSEQHKFTLTNNVLKLTNSIASPLDYESTNQYRIDCVHSDGFLESENTVLTLDITDVNEPPEFNKQAYYCVIDEGGIGVSNCDLGAVITDPEGNSYTVSLTGTNNNKFRYDESTSLLYFNVDYDVDVNNAAMPTTVTLDLEAEDIFGASSKVPLHITVKDVNDETCDFGATKLQHYSIDQNEPLGSLGALTATDRDLTSPNNEVTYELVRALPPDSTNYIAAYPDGSVYYTGLISDSKHGTSYSLIVRCKDGGLPQKTAEATVVVTYQVITTTTSTTTTTTTTTPTTTTPTTTTTTTTTTEEPDIWDNEGFVAIFGILMSLLGLALLAGLVALLKYCGACSGGGSPQRQPIRVTPEKNNDLDLRSRPDDLDSEINYGTRTNNNYQDKFWKTGDKFESGLPPRAHEAF